MIRLIDTHSHLDEVKDLDTVLKEAADAGVVAVVAVGIGYDSNQRILEISQKYKGFVYPALGLDPWQLGHISSADAERTLLQIEENINPAVAIGEIGLDYSRRVKELVSKDRQQAVLRDLMALAVKHSKPVSIHSRYSWKDALALAVEAGVKDAVFHWYTGPSSVLRNIIARGYFISTTPALEYHEEQRRVVLEASPENLLLETDSPVEYGRENRYVSTPADVRRVLKAAAEIKGMQEAALAERTTQNALRFFSIDISAKPNDIRL